MALQDPQDPTAGLGAPAPWEWPAEFQVDPRAYGIMPMDPALAAPPADPLQIGGTMGVVENAAAPSLAAPPPPTAAQAEAVPPPADPFNVLSPIDQTMADLSAGTVQAPLPGPPIAIPSPTDAFGRIASDVGAKVGPEAAQARWDGLGEDEKVRTLTSNPALLQQEEIDLETERLDRQREMIDQARANDQAQADQNARDHVAAVTKAQAETQRISAEAMQLANTKVVRDRRSGGRKFLDVIMGAIGGLVSAQTGGPNQGLAMVLKRIDDDVEDQKAELQNKTSMLGMRRSIVGEELARSGDMYKAQELARLAAYDATMADITTESMKYRPGSSRVIALAKMKIGLAQQRQAALDALQDRDVKRVFDRAKAEHALLENEALRRKNAGVGVTAPMITRAQIKADYGFDPGRDLTDKELDKLIDRKGKLSTQTALTADQERKAQDAKQKAGETLVGTAGEFKNKNGTEFSARTKEEGEKLRVTKSAVDLLSQMRNEISRGIAIHGGESDYFKSADWQRQKSRHAMTVAGVSKALQLGALDEGTTKLAEQLSGDVDPTSFWRDARPGLDQLVSNMAAKFTKDMESQGYDGPVYVPTKLATPGAPPTKTTVDKLSEGAQTRNFSERREAFFRFSGLSGIASTAIAAGDGERMQNIDALGFAADNPDPGQRDRAIAALEKAAADAPTDLTKQYARYVLDQVVHSKPGEHAAGVVTRAQ